MQIKVSTKLKIFKIFQNFQFEKMPPLTDQLYPFLTILAGIENSINLTSIDPPMQFLLEHNDKIAISNATIFYLDPYELRTFDNALNYCKDWNQRYRDMRAIFPMH